MKKRTKLIFAICLIAALMFAGCCGGLSMRPAYASGDEENPIRVGFVVNTMNHPYIMALDEFARKQAAEMGVRITVVDPQFEAQQQVDMINQFIAQGYDAIMVVPVDVTSNLSAYRAAKDAGIPIVEVGANSDGDTFELVSVAIIADQEEQGKSAAEALVKVLPDGGNIIVLQGSLGSSGQIGRDKGFEDYLADKPEYVILEKQTTDWMRDDAMTIMEDMLTKYNNIDAVYGHDDIIVAGAFEAIHAAGRDGILSVAVGASKDAIALIEAGDLTATVDQPPDYQGAKGLEIAVRLVRGETMDQIHDTPAKIITKDELDTFTPVW